MKKMLTKTRWLFTSLFFLWILSPHHVFADVFEYRHRAGDRYRIISVVHQDVFIARRLSHSAEIVNRIAVEVLEENDGVGLHRAIFQTSERSTAVAATSRSFQWAQEYESIFKRDRLGYMTIAPEFFMPVVRNVPVFPDMPLRPGDRWVAEGHEKHDFRQSFGIEEPFRIPFVATYEYLGEREWRGQSFPAFSVSYRILYNPAPVRGRVFPRRITGAADQIVFWNLALGQAVAYEEQFRIIIELSDGRTIEYRGRAYAEIYDAPEMDRDQIAAELIEEINRLNLPNVEIRVVDEGVAISIEDIQFYANTAIMLPGEIEKLDQIAQILMRFSERDILVAGHTALSGSAETRMALSRERAATVADYLINRNVRSPERIIVRGYGAERPVADNSTEEGMRRNRRVEITILEN